MLGYTVVIAQHSIAVCFSKW